MPPHSPLPFEIDSFRRDLASQNSQVILPWAGQQLYAAFWRLSPDKECPAVMKEQGRDYHVCSPNAGTIESLSAQSSFGEPLGEMVLKPLSLAEIARNARHHQAGIYLCNDEAAFCLYGGNILEFWSEAVITEDEHGQRVLYRAVEIFDFEGDGNVQAPQRGAVQYWFDITYRSDAKPEDYRSRSIYVFDDRFDWDSPLMPDLPDDARPASGLSPGARAFFDHIKASLLPSREIELVPPVHDASNHEALIEISSNSFSKLRAMVDRDLIPPAGDIKLTIKKAPFFHHASSSTSEPWQIDCHFITPTQHKVLFSSEYIEQALLKANDGLPDTIGTHCISETLRERLVDHLTLSMLHYSRTFRHVFFSDAFNGLLPKKILNRYHEFQPDYADTRFPCMAHFCCGPHRLPVLLLGQVDNQYVAQPLEHREIPSADVPSVLPQRSELIDSSTQRLSLFKQYRLALPESLVDFSCDAYQGARVSDQFLRDKFIADMRFSILSQPPEAQLQRKGGNASPIAISVAVIVIVLLVILWYNQG